MLRLYCLVKLDFNLLVRISNKPSNVLHLSFSTCVSNSINCRPFLPNQFFLLLLAAVHEVCYMIYIILFTSNLKFLSLLYLSFASQM